MQVDIDHELIGDLVALRPVLVYRLYENAQLSVVVGGGLHRDVVALRRWIL